MNTDSQSIWGIGSRSWGVALPVALTLVVSLSGCRQHHRPKLTPEQELSAFALRLSNSGADKAIESLLKPKADSVLKTTLAGEEAYLKRERDQRKRGESQQGGRAQDQLETDHAGESVSCYRAGCMREITFSDRATASAIQEHLLINPDAPFREWPGTAYFGPLVAGKDGSVRTIWALLIQPKRYDSVRAATASGGEGSIPFGVPAVGEAPRPTNVVLNVGTEKGEN